MLVFMQSDSRCQRYENILSKITPKYLGSEQNVSSHRGVPHAHVWLHEDGGGRRRHTHSFSLSELNLQVWKFAARVAMFFDRTSYDWQSPSTWIIARSPACLVWLANYRYRCWKRVPRPITVGRYFSSALIYSSDYYRWLRQNCVVLQVPWSYGPCACWAEVSAAFKWGRGDIQCHILLWDQQTQLWPLF